MKRIVTVVAAVALCAAVAQAAPPAKPAPGKMTEAVETKEVTYTAGGAELQGFFAYPAGLKDKAPGVIVVHEWWGHNQHARNQAVRLAKAGYVAFALDMYGKGKVAEHPDQAEAFMKEATKDPGAMMARFHAARAVLEKDPHVDPTKIAAIGYCFGGAVVLGAARAGDDLKAVGSFHGAIGTEHPAEAGKVKARVLVMTGADDTNVPPATVDAFKKEMDAAGAKYEVVVYPGARHSFTNPEADKHGMANLKYDAKADQESWAALLKMLKEVFGR